MFVDSKIGSIFASMFEDKFCTRTAKSLYRRDPISLGIAVQGLRSPYTEGTQFHWE